MEEVEIILYEEFLKGIGTSNTEATQYAYKVVNELYMGDEFKTKEDAYKFYQQNANIFRWIDEVQIGAHGKKAENTCKKIIDEDEAKKIINEWFCFELDRIEICGPAYYEATDWNFIRFTIKGYSRVLWNDSLYDVWR